MLQIGQFRIHPWGMKDQIVIETFHRLIECLIRTNDWVGYVESAFCTIFPLAPPTSLPTMTTTAMALRYASEAPVTDFIIDLICFHYLRHI